MNKACLVSVALGLFFLSNAVSVADVVIFPTGDCGWTVKVAPFTEDGATPAPVPPPTKNSFLTPTQIEVTQVDNVKRIRITWINGKTSEEWTLPKFPVVFKQDPRDGSVFPVQSSNMEMQNERASMPYDLAAFDWVRPDYLKEKTPIPYLEKLCFHYLLPGGGTGPTARDFAPGGIGYNAIGNLTPQHEAWIDAKTQLPVALHFGTSLYSFTFPAEPPTGPLVLPPNIKKEVDYYKTVMGYPAN